MTRHEPVPGDVACACGKPYLYCLSETVNGISADRDAWKRRAKALECEMKAMTHTPITDDEIERIIAEPLTPKEARAAEEMGARCQKRQAEVAQAFRDRDALAVIVAEMRKAIRILHPRTDVWSTPTDDEARIIRAALALDIPAAARIAEARRKQNAELLRLVKYMRPTYHMHTCQEGDVHEATCADAAEVLAEAEKMDRDEGGNVELNRSNDNPHSTCCPVCGRVCVKLQSAVLSAEVVYCPSHAERDALAVIVAELRAAAADAVGECGLNESLLGLARALALDVPVAVAVKIAEARRALCEAAMERYEDGSIDGGLRQMCEDLAEAEKEAR